MRKVLWNLHSSDHRAFDWQSKDPGLDTQRSVSVPSFTEKFATYISIYMYIYIYIYMCMYILMYMRARVPAYEYECTFTGEYE